MKIKAGFLPQIKTLMNGLIDKDFPFKRSIEIARFVTNQLEEEIKLVEQQRIKLCKELAKKDDKGNPVMNETRTNYIISDSLELHKKIETLKKNITESLPVKEQEELKIELDELLKKLETEKSQDKKFQDKMIELSEVEVDLEFNSFTEQELEAFKISPRTLIVLGELGFIENYKKETKPSSKELLEQGKENEILNKETEKIKELNKRYKI